MKKNKKYIIGSLVLLLLALLYSFNIGSKKVKMQDKLYAMQEFPTANQNYPIPNKEDEEAIEFKIDKETSDAEFLKIMEALKKKDIDVIFNNVERNEDGIITNIEIVVSKQDLSEEFSDTNPNGIQPILIKITDSKIYVGYAFQPEEDVFAFFNGNMQDEMAQIQKMMQRQMQMLQQMHGSSNNNNDIFAKFFGSDMMGGHDKMMQQMMRQMMQSDDVFFSNGSIHKGNSAPKVKTEIKVEKHYIVNGQEMSEEEYKKIDKSKIRSLQVYQTQVVSKSYGM